MGLGSLYTMATPQSASPTAPLKGEPLRGGLLLPPSGGSTAKRGWGRHGWICAIVRALCGGGQCGSGLPARSNLGGYTSPAPHQPSVRTGQLPLKGKPWAVSKPRLLLLPPLGGSGTKCRWGRQGRTSAIVCAFGGGGRCVFGSCRVLPWQLRKPGAPSAQCAHWAASPEGEATGRVYSARQNSPDGIRAVFISYISNFPAGGSFAEETAGGLVLILAGIEAVIAAAGAH